MTTPLAELRLLGPFEVLRRGEPVTIPGRTLPRLLAVLALHEGTVLATTAIIDALWNDAAPATALRQVQNGVSRLRGVLPDLAVEAVGDGYRLAPSGLDLDVRDFREAVTASWRLRRDGADAEALAVLRQGLDRWRGPALTGLGRGALAAQARGLDEARLDAMELRAELELNQGLPPPVAQLWELSERHPYRQRLAGLLMLALYRRGRSPEALTVYRSLRDRLAEELGIDPEPALRERHAAILREDPALDAHSPVAATDPDRAVEVPVPAQLPADIAGFTGREVQLAALDELLSAEHGTAVPAAITGTGGTGKTALAVHWAHRNRHRFPDGQLYVNLRGFDSGEPVAPREALAQLLTGLGQTGSAVPADIDAAAARFRSLVADRRMVIILDNARDLAQVRPLLPGGDGNLVLVTSRNRNSGLLALHGARPINVDIMSPDEARTVLTTVLGAERVRAEAAAAGRLAEVCGFLPLALRIAGANLAAEPGLSIGGYVTELSGPNRLELLSLDGDPEAAVATTFARSYRALPAKARELFARLGVIPGADFGADLAAAVGGLEPAETGRLLRTLTSQCLLEQYRDKRYRFHDLVREYARQCLGAGEAAAERDRIADRVVDWHHANRRKQGLGLEYGNIVAAFRAWRDHERCLGLASVLNSLANIGWGQAGLRELVEEAYTLAKRIGEPLHLHRVTNALGTLALHDGDTAGAIAHGEESLRHSLAHDGDDGGIARGNLAVTYYTQGEFARCEELLLKALAATDGRSHGNAESYRQNLGVLYCCLGDFDRAEHHFGKLDLRADSVAIATARLSKATVDILRGRLGEARSDVEAVLAAARDRLPRSESQALCLRGEIHRLCGELAAARADITASLALARRHRVSGAEVDALYELARVHYHPDGGEPDRQLLAEIAAAAERESGRRLLAKTWAARALVHQRLGEHREAAETGERAVELFAAMPMPVYQARTLLVLADADAALGAPAAARERRAEARAILTRLGIFEPAEPEANR